MRESLDEIHRIEQESNTSFYVKRFQIQSDENIKKLKIVEKENDKLRGNCAPLHSPRVEEHPAESSAYQAVCMGFLTAVECTGLFSNLQVRKILLLVTESLEPDTMILNTAKDILTEKLNNLFLEMRRFKNEVVHLRMELMNSGSEVAEDMGERENGFIAEGDNEDGGDEGENEGGGEGVENDGGEEGGEIKVDGRGKREEENGDYERRSEFLLSDDIPVQSGAENEGDESIEVEDAERGAEDNILYEGEDKDEEVDGVEEESLVNISLSSLRS